MANPADSVLKIFIGNEYKIRIEDPKDFNNSYFSGIYQQASNAVGQIITETGIAWEGEEAHGASSPRFEFNNIIAFVGERGSGKSSAMLSFANTFKPKSELPQEFPKSIKEQNYHVLPTIDPTLFEEGESIIRNIIARMFASFKERIEDDKNEEEYPYEKKAGLIKKFNDVYQSFQMLTADDKEIFKHHKSSESSLETLSGLASGVKLKDSFRQLVKEYLHFMLGNSGKDKARENYLVIPIDDLDMNMKNSYRVVEDIRRYLMMRNVVVLMAMKIDQLRDTIEQEYLKNYEKLIKAGKQPYSTTEEMANRYLEKIVPIERRLYLPVVRPEISGKGGETKLYFGKERDKDNKVIEIDPKKLAPIQDTVLGHTYEATGIYFEVSREEAHLLVPDTLRELQNYLVFLERLKQIQVVEIPGEDDSDKKNRERIAQLIQFKDFFLQSWVNNSLEKEQERFVHEIEKTPNYRKNKFIISSYLKSNPSFWAGIKEFEEEVKEAYSLRWEVLVERTNNPRNVSLGDLLSFLEMVEEYSGARSVKKLNFSIKTLLTLEMQIALEENRSWDCQDIINGRIFDPNAYKLIPREGNEKNRQVFKILEIQDRFFPKEKNSDGKETFGFYKNQLDTYFSGTLKDGSSLQSPFFLQIFEFIHAFIYPQEVGLERSSYRKSAKPYYLQQAGYSNSFGQVTIAYFDVFAWIYFCAHPVSNFSRFAPSEIDLINFESLFNKSFSKYSLFRGSTPDGDELKCPFPFLYNVEILEWILLAFEQSFDLQFRKRKGKAYSDLVEASFNMIANIIKSFAKENKFFADDDSYWDEINDFKNNPFFLLLSNSQQGKTLRKVIDELWDEFPEAKSSEPLEKVDLKDMAMAHIDFKELQKLISRKVYKYKWHRLEEWIIDRIDFLEKYGKNLPLAFLRTQTKATKNRVQKVRDTHYGQLDWSIKQDRQGLLEDLKKELEAFIKKHS